MTTTLTTSTVPAVTTQQALVRDRYGRAFHAVEQGSVEWLDLRRGLITASEVSKLITPGLKIAANDKERAHVNELAAQRITGYLEPNYVSSDMLRGHAEEVVARELYALHRHPVQAVGFVTRLIRGIVIGASPDGLIGDDGTLEVKSRRQKYQVETILSGCVPDEYILQVQTQLLVTRRPWCDFVSICGGMPLFICRVPADAKIQEAILQACLLAEERISQKVNAYRAATADAIMTDRIPEAQDSEIL